MSSKKKQRKNMRAQKKINANSSNAHVEKTLWEEVIRTFCQRDVYQDYQLLDEEEQLQMKNAVKAMVSQNAMSPGFKPFYQRFGPTEMAAGIRDEELQLLKSCIADVNKGRRNIFNDYVLLKNVLSSWGRIQSSDEILNKARQFRIHQYPLALQNMTQLNNSDATNRKVCSTSTHDLSHLKRIYAKDLVLFKTAKGCFIEGQIVLEPYVLTCITVFLKDSNGDVIHTALYNQFPFSNSQHSDRHQYAMKMFPAGQKINICEPYYKIFADGNRGVRVDTPSDVIFNQVSYQSIKECREAGKKLASKSEHLAALNVYFSCLKSHSKDVIAILNNRAQTEIKLEHYDQALLDAASVLLLDYENKKGLQRYQFAFDALSDTLKTGTMQPGVELYWLLLLENGIGRRKEKLKSSTKEAGYEAYLEGDYARAKTLYSGALLAYDEFAVILSNVAIMCNNLQIYHTAIAAANACIRITHDPALQEKASYNMALAFIMLGECKMSKLAAHLVQETLLKDKLETMWVKLEKGVDTVAKDLMSIRAMSVLGASDSNVNLVKEIHSVEGEIYNDFVKSDVLEHAYIPNKGRGIIATKRIKEGSILLFEHGVRYNIPKLEKEFVNINVDSKVDDFGGMQAKLVQHLLGLVKYDGLLVQKLLQLESEKSATQKLDLIANLGSFSIRHLHGDIKPFMSQNLQTVREQSALISEEYLKNVVNFNTYRSSPEEQMNKNTSITLYPTISLLHHSSEQNCAQTLIASGMVVWAIKDIKINEVLTIDYTENSDLLKRWGTCQLQEN